MSRPGDRLRAFAARHCGEDTMARLIDPVIADLQTEHALALRHGPVWRSRWVRLAGYIAFVKVFAVCEWSPLDDRRSLTRVAVWSLGVAAVATAVFVAPPYRRWLGNDGVQETLWRGLLTLVPQALVLAVPIGLGVGSVLGLAGRRVSGRLATAILATALIGSFGSVVNIGWIVPETNQAFRTIVFRTHGWDGLPARGDNELTFAELSQEIKRSQIFPVGTSEWKTATRLRIGLHNRWAFAFATFVVTMFSMCLTTCTGRKSAIAGVVAGLFGYFVVAEFSRFLALDHALAPAVAAWLPNILLAITSAGLWGIRSRPVAR